MLSRDQILAAQDLPFEDVEIPEWGGQVRIRALTGREVEVLTRAQAKGEEVSIIKLALPLCLIDEDGNRLFTDEDMEALWEKNAAILLRLGVIALKISNLDPESNKELIETFE
jgi:hypothetical protein